jgi:hypothetical protein
MSAFRGKAELERHGEESPLLTQSGHPNGLRTKIDYSRPYSIQFFSVWNFVPQTFVDCGSFNVAPSRSAAADKLGLDADMEI